MLNETHGGVDLVIPKGLPKVVDGTWFKSQVCKRKAYLRHVMHLVPIRVSPALRAGAAVHEAVHLWFTGNDQAEPESPESAFLGAKWIEDNYEEAPRDPRTKEFLIFLLKEYIATHQRPPRPWVVEMSEIGFSLPLCDSPSIMWGGRIDRLIRWDDGGLYVNDLKTSSRLGSYWARQWRLDISLTGYCWGAGLLKGEQCMGVLVEGLSTAKNPQSRTLPYLATRTPDNLEDFVRSARNTCLDWLAMCDQCQQGEYPLDVFYQEFTACNDYSGCPYREICIGGLSPSIIEGSYKVEPWTPFEEEEE